MKEKLCCWRCYEGGGDKKCWCSSQIRASVGGLDSHELFLLENRASFGDRDSHKGCFSKVHASFGGLGFDRRPPLAKYAIGVVGRAVSTRSSQRLVGLGLHTQAGCVLHDAPSST